MHPVVCLNLLAGLLAFPSFGASEPLVPGDQAPHARQAAPFTGHPVRADDAPVTAPRAAPGVDACGISYGFLPYWISASSVDFSALTHLAAFSVEINQSGLVANARGWPWHNTVAAAQSAGVKVHLTVTNFSPSQILTLLTTPANRAQAIETIAQQALLGQADGVCIDFEGSVSNGWPAHLPAFVADLRARLRQDNPEAEVAVATPAVNWGHWNFAALAQAADLIFIMGYDFHGSWSNATGPSAPLAGGGINVTNTVATQYAGARAVAPEKLVLGLPLYGNSWLASGSGKGATVISHLGSITYANAVPQSQTHGRRWDTASQTPWYRWQQGSDWRQVWYDDAESLGLKIDLAQQYDLGGVGAWALGYQGSDGQVWSLLRDRIRVNCPCSPADLVPPFGEVNIFDLGAYINLFINQDPAADLAEPFGVFNFFDMAAYLQLFTAGCP
ncbi:MAG: hypothetical protein LAT64_11400 [Phycisphaerales bacterium]|nr:hypothetical protein [Planctomycetota bacterium]MCH8509357.1 hypothetical protein [Phycisphaerales bacterium]